MTGPMTLLLLLLVAAPLIYVGVMSFCSIDEYYNVVFRFTTENYARLVSLDYLKIYGQSLLIAFVTTVICILIGYPFSWLIARTKSKYKKILYMLVDRSLLDQLADPRLWVENLSGNERLAEYGAAVPASDRRAAGFPV